MCNLRSLPKLLLIISVTAWLAACGGGSSDSKADTNCVLGSSKIGECKI